jgi:DNA-binding transcriptional ArsR family regulator
MVNNPGQTRNPNETKPSWRLLSAAGDPTREAILALLGRGPMPAGRIAAGFRMTRPAVSRHLRILRESGWLVEERRGRHRVYRLARPALSTLLAWVNELARPPIRPEARPAVAPAAGRPRELSDDWAPWSD